MEQKAPHNYHCRKAEYPEETIMAILAMLDIIDSMVASLRKAIGSYKLRDPANKGLHLVPPPEDSWRA